MQLGSLLAPFPSDSPHGHLKESTDEASSWNSATHQYIRNPNERNMNGTMYMIQEFEVFLPKAASIINPRKAENIRKQDERS